MSMKNSNDNIGNRIRDLSGFSAVSQPTAPPGAPNMRIVMTYNYEILKSYFRQKNVRHVTDMIGEPSDKC